MMIDRNGCRSCLDLSECMEHGKPRDSRAVLVGCTKSSKSFYGGAHKNEWVKRETVESKKSGEKSRNKRKEGRKIRGKNSKANDKGEVVLK